jgi:hypothetical protein
MLLDIIIENIMTKKEFILQNQFIPGQAMLAMQ